MTDHCIEKWYVVDENGKIQRIDFEELPQHAGFMFLEYEENKTGRGNKKAYCRLFSPFGEEIKTIIERIDTRSNVEKFNSEINELRKFIRQSSGSDYKSLIN